MRTSEADLVEVLAEREPFRPALRDKATAIVISAPAKALDKRVERVEAVLLSALVEKAILPLLRGRESRGEGRPKYSGPARCLPSEGKERETALA